MIRTLLATGLLTLSMFAIPAFAEESETVLAGSSNAAYEEVLEEATMAEITLPPVVEQIIQAPEPIYLGTYKLTAYCSCSKCCGKWGGKRTSSGTIPTVGRTVGCNSLPAGTRILINGHEYTVEDTGNMRNNVIDIYMGSHQAARNFGVQHNVPVFMIP